MHNVAVIGCGYWGKNLVRNMQSLGALAAVMDSTETGRALARKLAPGAIIYDNFADVLQNPDIKGVVIATPAETHAPLTEQALAAGKDVLCEKPLALRYEDGRRLVRLASERGRILMVGHLLEYHPAVRKMIELCHQGDLGKVFYVMSTGRHPRDYPALAGDLLEQPDGDRLLKLNDLVNTACALDPVRRYQTAAKMRRDLQGVIGEQPGSDVDTETENPELDLPSEIEPAGGAVPLDSGYYVERPVDLDFLKAIERRDSIVLVKGARQMGKILKMP